MWSSGTSTGPIKIVRGHRTEKKPRMASQKAEDYPNEDVMVLNREKGTSVLAHLFGATLISWKYRGVENIFLSTKAVFDKKKAIRGGIPLVFPNFGPWSLGPQHGFARIKLWAVEQQPSVDGNGDVTAVLSLTDDDETRAMWNHKFKLLYTIILKEDSLTTKLAVHNNNEKDSFDFTCLFHTYFRLSNVSNTAISGLKGITFSDKIEGDKEDKETHEEISVDKNYDRVYRNVPGVVKITKCPISDRQMEVSFSNLPDVVLWNPWDEKAKVMSDFDDLEYLRMVCVEGGSVSTPNKLSCGECFECQQVLKPSFSPFDI